MKIRTVFTALAAATAIAGFGVPAVADPGQDEYMNSCAACHGVDGDGRGPMWDLISVQVPDLTQLAANNDGVFPMLEVIHMIDGRTGLRGHGSEMPIWGDRYKADVEDTTGEYGAEMIIRGRTLSLALYLESIQK